MCAENKGADKGRVIESTVVLISGASLTLIKHRSSLNRADTPDQTDVLPWQPGSVVEEGEEEEEDRSVEGVKTIYIQQSAGSQLLR